MRTIIKKTAKKEEKIHGLLQQLSNKLDPSALEKVFLLSDKLPHHLDLPLLSELDMETLYGNVSTAIQMVNDSKNGNNKLIALNMIAKLLKLNIIDAARLSTDTVGRIRILAITAMTKIYVIDIQDELHQSNHHLGQFISDIRHLIVLDPNCEEMLDSAINMINYYFNVGLKSIELNKLKIGYQLITSSSLSQALDLVTKINASHLEKKKYFIENSILAWVANLNKKWAYNKQDMSYSILKICQLMHKNLFSNAEKILTYLNEFLLDILNKDNDFKSLSDKASANILEALSLIEKHDPNYSKYKKMIEEMRKPQPLTILDHDPTLSEISTLKTTEVQPSSLFDAKNSTTTSYTEQISHTFFDTLSPKSIEERQEPKHRDTFTSITTNTST